MNALRTLLLLAAGLSVACCDPITSPQYASLMNFWKQIQCDMPVNWSVLKYANYGCYCGKGGFGTPVDELDRCCEAHDNCYGDAMKLDRCWPYVVGYSFRCDRAGRTLTCGENNNECQMFLCECDRKASECFTETTYNPQYRNLPKERCLFETWIA